MLTTYPNMVIDVSGAHGRARPPAAGVRAPDLAAPPSGCCSAPTTSRRPPTLYRRWYRFLESDDEYFPYSPRDEGAPPQGRWAVSALNLPADVLEQVYRTNARRVLGLR